MDDTHWHLIRSWMDQASDGIFVADASGIYLDVNRRGCELLRRPREDILGRHLRDMISPDELAYRPVALERIETGRAYLTERRMLRGDGTVFVAELSTTRTSEGLFLAIVRDVTARREGEDAARRAEANFRALLDVLPDAVVVHTKGIIVYVNATTVRVAGYDRPDELIGIPVIEIVHPDDRALVMARVRSMSTTGQAAGLQRERFLRRDGSSFVCEVVALPLTFDGRPSLLAVARDVTERDRMQARLAQTERLASIGLLAAGVAHEINNPLAYALLNLERVSEQLGATLDPDEVRKSVEDAVDGARRVQRIVRDLKTFAGSLQDEVARVDVRTAIDAALKLSANELRFRARVVRDLGEVPPVRVNEARLTQVLLNLLMNAAHALPEGDASHHEVRVTARAVGSEVRIEVHDDGAGIAPENIAKLFDPFFTTRAPGHGTGLGLSICHSIVSSFGGRIEVESALGKGSTFSVVLPAAEPSLPEPEPAERQRASSPPETRQRLLLVEDERNMRTVLKALLASRYEVVTAATGAEAQRILDKDGAWDVVLCDLLMPEVTGMDLFEWLEVQRPDLCDRVVFMTGGAFTDRAKSVLDRAPGRWIEKPFEFETLAVLLERVTPLR
ncbi:MAG: PAS domain S-box protein [Polyangiales bacterium]